MTRKTTKKQPSSSLPGSLFLIGTVAALTLLRLAVATAGSITGEEALLFVCASHPAGSYVEGPAGVPLLLGLLRALGLTGVITLRYVPILALVPLTWCLWWIARRMAPHRPSVALWTALLFNLLPPVNAASLVMNGAVLTALFPVLALVAGWRAAIASSGRLLAWTLFGIALAVATLFWQYSGILLPATLAACFLRQGWKSIPWKGFVVAGSFLTLGWVPSLAWNARHDWIQWSSVATGFDQVSVLGVGCSLGLLVMLCCIVTPLLIRVAFRGMICRVAVIAFGLGCSVGSSLILMAPGYLPPGLPNPEGVSGLGALAETVMQLRSQRSDPRGKSPFLIAQSPGLAALLGSKVNGGYPERPGAPSVFAAESPSLNSSYAFWPSYQDAVAAAVKDILYTEEKSVSPFLGRNALYITTESREELPQTITGAFGAVGLLKEIPIQEGRKTRIVRIYQCEDYHTLSL
jgi:Dolichyl-phosphate-mannose-protein mannosyltransferase